MLTHGKKTTARYSSHPATRSEAVGFRCVYTDDIEDGAKRGNIASANTATGSHLLPHQAGGRRRGFRDSSSLWDLRHE